MNKKTISYILTIGILILVAFIVKGTFNQPGIKDMRAGFKEIIKYRNENNTGPVQRIYVVTVKDTLWQEMENYGNLMPHTKYGNTKVYFFKAGTDVPQKLDPGSVNFDSKFDQNCLAVYEKSAMSQVAFNKKKH